MFDNDKGVQYINGVKVRVSKSSGITWYETDDETVSFRQWINSDNRVELRGVACGEKGRETVNRMFPKMELRNRVGASDDGGDFDDFRCYEFGKTETW